MLHHTVVVPTSCPHSVHRKPSSRSIAFCAVWRVMARPGGFLIRCTHSDVICITSRGATLVHRLQYTGHATRLVGFGFLGLAVRRSEPMRWPVSPRRSHRGSASTVVGSNSAGMVGWLEQVVRRHPKCVGQGAARPRDGPADLSDVAAPHDGRLGRARFVLTPIRVLDPWASLTRAGTLASGSNPCRWSAGCGAKGRYRRPRVELQ